MPYGESSKSISFDEQLVVMDHAGLCVHLLGHQLSVIVRPVEHIRRLAVRDARRPGEVAARRLVADDEGVGAVQSGGHDDSDAARTGVAAAASSRVEQAIVGVVDDERSNVDAADDQASAGGLVNATVCLQLWTIDAAVDAPH